MTKESMMGDRETTIILAIPIIGLIYCGIVFGALLLFPALRNYAPLVAGIVMLIPLIIGVSIWISPSVKQDENGRNNDGSIPPK